MSFYNYSQQFILLTYITLLYIILQYITENTLKIWTLLVLHYSAIGKKKVQLCIIDFII